MQDQKISLEQLKSENECLRVQISDLQKSLYESENEYQLALNELEKYQEQLACQKQTNIELRKLRKQAKESTNLKAAFLATISHEIRTPMNGILGFASLIDDHPLNEQQRKYLQHLEESAQTLLKLVNDLLDLAKIRAGQISLHYEYCELGNLLQKLHESYQERITRQQLPLQIKCEFEKLDNKLIFTDPLRLQQIIEYLLDNAIKFTPSGHVKFGYQVHARKGLIHFFVSDTGIGIAKGQLKTIFSRFYQVEGSLNRYFSGTGLGLAIVYALVKLFDSEIEVQSELGKGSTFSFSIPYLTEQHKINC